MFSVIAARAPAAPLKTYGTLLSDTKREENYAVMAHLIECIHAAAAAASSTRPAGGRAPSGGSTRKRSGAASAPVPGSGASAAAPTLVHPPWVGVGGDSEPDLPESGSSVNVSRANESPPSPPSSQARHANGRPPPSASSSPPRSPAAVRATRGPRQPRPPSQQAHDSGRAATPRTGTGSGGVTSPAGESPSAARYDALQSAHTQLRAAYDLLVTDKGAESLDARRLHLLKAQNVQLERQVLLYSRALDARADAIQAVENVVSRVASEAAAAASHPPSATDRGSKAGGRLAALAEQAAEAERKLEAASTLRDSVASTGIPLFVASRFSSNRDAMVLDVCSGASARRVPPETIDRLERELAALHAELSELRAALAVAAPAVSAGVGGPLGARLDRAAACCEARVDPVVSDLQQLLGVLPAGAATLRPPPPPPSADLGGSLYLEALPTADEVLSAVTAASGPAGRPSQKQGRAAVKDLVGRARSVVTLAAAAETKLKHELALHWKLHEVHTDYAGRLHTELVAVEAAHAAAAPALERLAAAYDGMVRERTEAALGEYVAAGEGVAAALDCLGRVGEAAEVAGSLQRDFVEQLEQTEREHHSAAPS